LLVLLHRMLAPVKSHQSWFFFFVGFVYLFFCLLGVSNLIQNWNFAIGLIKKTFFCFVFVLSVTFALLRGQRLFRILFRCSCRKFKTT
jgi:hypothetical protein